MPDASIPLALYDFVPVAISAVGLGLVAWHVGRIVPALATWAALGVVLIVSAGLARATWKLVVAAGGSDVAVLHGALYVLLAPGFLILGTVVWRARGGIATATGARTPPWLVAASTVVVLVLATVILGPSGGRFVPLIWLAAATCGVALVSVGLFLLARHRGRSRLAWLFIAYLAITIALNGLARASVQTESLQWVEQSLNTLDQVLFLVAALQLFGIPARGPEAETVSGR
jgi:hypothetical protein